MQNTTPKWQWMFFGIAVLLALSAYVICLPARNGEAKQAVETAAAFGTSNYNLMKTDTFVMLLHKTYGTAVTDKKEENKLVIEMKANDASGSFYNGNNELLKFGLNDFGFDIKYNQQEKSVKAIFNIQTGNGVNVPNDVLIKLMDKTTDVTHVNQ